MHLDGLEASNSARSPGIVGYLEIEETLKAVGRYRVHGEYLIIDDWNPACGILELQFCQKIIGENSRLSQDQWSTLFANHDRRRESSFFYALLCERSLLFLREEQKLTQQ